MINVSAVSRGMQVSSGPTLVEVDGIVAPQQFSLTETLNQPPELSFMMFPSKQAPAVLSRFLDMTAQGTEFWVWDDDGTRLFSGEALGYSPALQGDDLVWTMRAVGLLSYLRRWRVEPDGADLVYTAVDQATIAKNLIDYYQALSYGNYGIGTSSVGTTGVTRDRTYPAIEAHLIAQRISELAAVDNGFDFYIEHASRDFKVAYPAQGTDKSNDIVIDSRGIADPSAQISVGPEDVASEGFGVGDNELVSHQSNTTLRAALGRSGFAASFSGVSVQSTLDDHAQRLINQRSTQLHLPARTLYEIGFDWGDFGIGDLVEFAYDYGAGAMVEQRRIYSRQLSITSEGLRTIGVSLE